MTNTRWLVSVLWLATVVAVAADPDPQLETLQAGVHLSLLAEHPGLATPTGIDVDEQGRVWVVATHTHFRPDDYDGPEHDEILVFFDADGDGTAEKRTLFYNATAATMDLELGADGWVYLAERDRILRIKDSDGDGSADLEQDIANLATEADYPHNGLSGLAWHPDGDLVFGLGENYAKPWILTGADGVALQGTGEGGVFRCSAEGTQLRRIARGFWNPFGICVRSDGEIFAAENDPGARPPCRLLHVVEGGDYGFQRLYGPEAHHPFVCWNGELRGTLPMIHPAGEAPCGVLPLGGGLLVPSWTDHRIDFYPLRRQGASYTSTRVVLVQGGSHFRPVCIAQRQDGPAARSALEEGKVTFYLSDWVYVSYQLHGQGRVWKLEIDLKEADWIDLKQPAAPNAEAALAAELRSGESQHAVSELLKIAASEDPFLAQAALVALSRQAAQWQPTQVMRWNTADLVTAVQALKLATSRPDSNLNAELWVRRFLSVQSREVQFETLRWIADAQLTSFLPDVERLLQKDDLDFHLFEALAASWNTLSGQPSEGVRNTDMLLGQIRRESASPKIRAFALRLLPAVSRVAAEDGSEPSLEFPKGLDLELLQQLLFVGDESLSCEVVRTLAGYPRPAAQEILVAIATSERQSLRLRIEAVAGLAAVSARHGALLIQLAGEKQQALREEALRSLRGAVLQPNQSRQLALIAEQYPQSADLVQAVIDPNSLALGRPDPHDIKAWQERIDDIPSPPDPECGERIFHHSRIALCSRCHRHTGRGNVVGPDLSQVAKGQLRSGLLESLLQPNLKVAPEYRARTLLLEGGRVFTGIHLRTGGGGDVETLRDSNGQERKFPRSEIEMSREIMTSLMPDNLSASLTDRELRDLLAFLQSSD